MRVTDVAGDFLTCWGDDLGPRGEKAAWAGLEKGVETGGVAPANCEGVRPCWEGACFIGVDMMRNRLRCANVLHELRAGKGKQSARRRRRRRQARLKQCHQSEACDCGSCCRQGLRATSASIAEAGSRALAQLQRAKIRGRSSTGC
jgi:hypothetical protein